MSNKSRFYLKFLIIFAVLLNSFSIIGTVFAEDRTNILENLEVGIVQNGKVLQENEIIDGKKDITFNISFKVPLVGDSTPGPHVNHNDTARIVLGKGINIATNTFKLQKDGKVFGTATYTTLPDKNVVMEILFDGDKDVFDGSIGYHDLEIDASANAKLDNSNIINENGQRVIMILGKKYPVEIKPDFQVNKTGVLNETDRTVEWTITVTGKKMEEDIDLNGYVLSDDITNAGEYKPSSFKVGDVIVDPEISGNNLKYTFKQGQKSPQTIKLKTQIRDEDFFKSIRVTGQEQEDAIIKTNIAKLSDNAEKDIVSSTAKVEIPPKKWIEKKLVSREFKVDVNGDYYEVIWHIDIYNNGFTLKNLVIKDELIGVSGFEHVSAKTVPMDESGKIVNGFTIKDNINPVIKENIPPVVKNKNGEKVAQYYEIGDVDKNTKFILVTKIKKDDLTYTEGSNNYRNNSKNTWEGRTTPLIASATVGIGKGIVTKGIDSESGTSFQNSSTEQQAIFVGTKMKWKVSLNDNITDYTTGNFKLYDIMIYDDTVTYSDIGYNGIEKMTLTLKDEKQEVGEDLFKSLLPKVHLTYQKMDVSTFEGNGLTPKTYTIYKGDKPVGDLLEVSGFSKDNKSFSITSDLKSSGLINGEGMHGITENKKDLALHNDVFAVRNNNPVDGSRGYARYKSKMISKDVLTAEDAKELKKYYVSEHINTVNDNKESAFNHETNSVIYAISLNAHGHKDTKDYLGNVTVTDTLPEGWEFVNIKDDSKYIIYKGTPQSNNLSDDNAKVKAMGDIITNISEEFGSIIQQDISSNEISLTFENLKGPYVLLLEAKPTKNKLKDYAKNVENNSTERNNIKVTAKGKEIRKTQDIVFSKKILKKEKLKVTDGVLKWNIDYLPNGIIDEQHVYLKDELSEGMELRTDSTGNLVFDNDNFEIQEISSVDFSDNVVLGEKLSNIQDYITYEKDTRILKLVIPNKDKSYRFSYITDLTGKANTDVSNIVSLVGGDVQPTVKPASYSIKGQDVSASIQKNAFLEVIKKNEEGILLENAEFSLILEDGTIMKSKSGINGRARFDRIPLTNGNGHTLKETKAPDGYKVDENEYKVIVDKTKSPMVSITGTKEKLPNIITITNTKDIPKVSTDGILRVSKIVTGNQGETDREFEFTFNLTDLPQGSPDISSYDYKIIEGTNFSNVEKINKTDGTFSLKNNQKIEITGLPIGASYNIEEKDYTNEGYVTEKFRESGKISANTETVEFVNIKNVQQQSTTTSTSLTISKLVRGKLANTTDKFRFEIYFDTDASKEYKYSIDRMVQEKPIGNGDSFELSGGQSVIIKDIKIGEEFTIKEVDAGGYEPNKEQINVKVTTEPTLNIVEFVNTKNQKVEYGTLKITKTIEGNVADTSKKFKFTVKLGTDANKLYNYDGIGTITNGSLKTGDVIELSNGDGLVIKDIEVGTSYEVSEDSEDYTKTSTGDKGTIVLGENLAKFKNTKNSTGGGTGGPGGGSSSTPDKQDEPKKSDEPKKQDEPKKSDEPKKQDEPKKSDEPKKQDEPQKPKTSDNMENPNTPNENPNKEPIKYIPTSNIKPPTDTPFKPMNIIGRIPENKNPILTIIDENGVPIGKAEVNIQEGTYMFIEDERAPEGTAKIYNNNVLEILEENTPKSTPKKILSKRTLPKTGSEQGYYYLVGFMLLGMGSVLRKRKKK